MKVAVLGAGAMGGIVAVGLHRGGHDPLIIDPWKPHVETIRTLGFLMTEGQTGALKEWRGVIPAIHTEELAQVREKLDILFLSVKGYNTRKYAEMIRPYLADDAMVVSVQNGINEPIIADVVGPERTIGCETLMAAQTWEPGHIHRTHGGGSTPGAVEYMIGEYAGGTTPRVEHLAQMLRDSVGTCEVSDHIMDEVWTKFVVNCGGNLLAAITSWDTRELTLNGTMHLRWALQAEAIAVGEQLGVNFGGFGGSVGVILASQDVREAAAGSRPDLEAQVVEQASAMTRVTRPSTLHDALRGTPMEVDQINGYVVARAEELEIPVPYNRAIVRIAKLVDEHKLRPYPANLALFREYVQEELARTGS